MIISDAFELVAVVLAEHVGTEPARITRDQRVLDDLALDSVDAVELLISLERRAGIRFDIDDLEDIATVDDIVSRLEAALRQPVEHQ